MIEKDEEKVGQYQIFRMNGDRKEVVDAGEDFPFKSLRFYFLSSKVLINRKNLNIWSSYND
jgi:hypothetical protein